ncbi:ALI_HP2_G0035670.mRNA.1.CDS.1 [Saccharomyces cerevisiae]|nr:ALI_HP2_G0035670.mRNA.1.CDS.1 [Saccharomyces cerevisiae]CAI6576437.1 ALI_HP2_G0035670.mRNA.1.CDS.1 [Saccharomyces cerevisiae]CAI6663827.1 ALI_HP1_G0037390.mRNA.1.CDS.1 [Saccharomyces cerevisiae]CAI6818610.1 ALI_collapsed_G0038730.mRNA.1.CDS.1 [Saccharomyces cerevisiae]
MVNNSQHPYIKDGWFREINDKSFPGQAFTMTVDSILYEARSEFQDILIFRNKVYGTVLVLDGIVQCTEFDEFAYQEMITHIAMFVHSNPKRVLIIGGGDGGVLREVAKHSCVEDITMVEIDSSVIELSRKFLPTLSNGAFDDERLDLKLCDGFKFLQDIGASDVHKKFDVIITDSSDPEGPAEAFFQERYFELLKDALNPNGVVIMQSSENFWLNLKYLHDLKNTAKKVFPNTEYCYTMVPTYTSGQLGLIVCSNNANIPLNIPQRKISEQEQGKLKYYNPQIHSSAFVLPTWADKVINE